MMVKRENGDKCRKNGNIFLLDIQLFCRVTNNQSTVEYCGSKFALDLANQK